LRQAAAASLSFFSSLPVDNTINLVCESFQIQEETLNFHNNVLVEAKSETAIRVCVCVCE
jgi:hypothetical protein